MEGRMTPVGMTAEELAEAERLFEVTEKAQAEELWRLCCSVVSKKDKDVLGQNEFDMRDRIHRMGARVLEAAINERKKGVTTEVASLASNASTTPDS